MTTDYTGYAMYQQAVQAYGQEAFARWLCETCPWGGVDLARARARWLVEDLADFRQYPPDGGSSTQKRGPMFTDREPTGPTGPTGHHH
jgi:hypothetical protein